MRTRFLLSLLFLVAVFNACQKDVKQSPVSSSTVSNLSAAPYNSLAFSQNPAFVGQLVNISGSLALDESIPVCGTLVLQQAFDSVGDPVSSAFSGTITWTDVASIQPGTTGTVSYDWTPTATGFFGFRLHFIPNNDCHGNAYNGQPGPGMDLQVVASCTGLSVAVTSASATLITGSTYSVNVCFTVNTCGDTYTNVKLQGGLTANAVNSSIATDPTASTITVKNKTAVINWKETSLTGSKVYCATFTQTFKGVAPYQATGAWSVVGTKGGVQTKSDYTVPVTFTP